MLLIPSILKNAYSIQNGSIGKQLGEVKPPILRYFPRLALHIISFLGSSLVGSVYKNETVRITV